MSAHFFSGRTRGIQCPVGLALALGLGLSGVLARSASAQIITEYPLPTPQSFPGSIVAGPDGYLWFTEAGTYQIGRITVDGSIDGFTITDCCPALTITVGPDGNLWYTEFVQPNEPGKMGRITTTGDAIEFTIPTFGPSSGIAAGPDGNVWFTEGHDNQVARITPDLVVTEFWVPTPYSWPLQITAGPDGNLWFTENDAGKIGRITPSGSITEFNTPTADSHPEGIAVGPDGNLWFTERAGGINFGKIGRITTDGVVTEFLSGLSYPSVITAGPDGNLWFTESYANRIWRLTTDGVGTPYSIPTPYSNPVGIAWGPDGAIWFTEYAIAANKIGKISVPPTPTPTPTFTATMTPTPTPTPSLQVWGIGPSSGPAAGGTPVMVSGSAFLPAASLTIGGVMAENVVVVSSAEITASTPALSPGTLNDVAVFNPARSIPRLPLASATLLGGWMADFLDVSQEDIFHGQVEKVFRRGITAGCGAGNYCRNDAVTRAQMAVFLLKSEHGSAYVPPACTGIFGDVACPSLFADWIEQLSLEGATGGCGGGHFCPTSAVTRQQMSAFLLKTKHGANYVPPACAGIFEDVACPSLFADWVEELYSEGITGGCSTSPLLYCPGSSNTRGQMAVFLVKAFNIP